MGDRERAKGLSTISPFCDRTTDTNIPKMQIGFFNFVCTPFYAVVADLVDPDMAPLERLRNNLNQWQVESKQSSRQLWKKAMKSVLK